MNRYLSKNIIIASSVILSMLIVSAPAFATEHHPEEFLESIQGKSDAGEQIYTHFCANCHAVEPLIPMNAPCIGVKTDWARYTKTQTVDQMVKTIDVGIGAMPPRGGCFECSDEDLKAAIIYMLPK